MTTAAKLRRAPILLSTLTSLVAAGCAGGGPQPYAAGTVLVPEAPVAETTALPDLPVAQTAPSAAPTQRIQQLVAHEDDLRAVLRGLAESYGLDYQIDPAVTGTVSTSLQDVTLTQALDAIVLPHGFSYQLEGRVLRVTRTRVQTKIFSLDYLSMSRVGSATTTIQRQLGGRGGQPGVGVGSLAGGVTGFGGGGGGEMIQTVSVSDLWEEIRISLEGLLFDGSAGGVVDLNRPVDPALGGRGLSRGPTSFSRSAEDGRRLILNPASGTIVVSASPEKLAEIEAFLATVEGSVHRQVLIEAKIVEVALNRRFEFGIDWSFVQRLGNIRLQLGGGESGAQFTLGSGAGDTEGQINVVLRALEHQGDVSVLLSPRVRGLNNQWAVINASTDQVFFTVSREPILGPNGGTIGFDTQIQPQQVAVGVTLNVLPQIAPDNTITMNVKPTITDVISERSVVLPDGSQATAPVIDRRESDTVVRVRNGETVVIGGLMTTKQRNSGTGVPGLREIPLIGGLFGGSTRELEKRELVIFITPRIVAGQAAAF